jgi:uncharacterized 2Fe-2S/4Fe-4S cluster protein (DUF4445 family)
MTRRPTVSVTIAGMGRFALPAGEILRASLRREGVVIDGACLAAGRCGRCAVLVTEGDPGVPGAEERGLLRAGGREEGAWRLACRMVLVEDITVEVKREQLLEIDRTGRWKETWESPLWDAARFPPDPAGPGSFGVALDLGTTALAAALIDLRTGLPIDLIAGANPQMAFGADVLTRLQAAREGLQKAGELHAGLWRAAGGMVEALCVRNGLSPALLQRVTAVGNSAMRQLALGRSPGELLNPPFEVSDRGPAESPFSRVGWGGEGKVSFPAVLGGFVGSDALAALVAARPGSAGGTGILLDIGTNCEIVAWGPRGVRAASAPAGPAFEGGGIGRGMRAEEGAVFRVRLTATTVETGVIGGGEMRGICGTGLVDASAELVRLGLLDHRGLMRAGAHPALSARGLALDQAGKVLVTSADLAELQKAKAAISAGMQVLTSILDIGSWMLDKIYLAGAFGSRLDLDAAVRIGLLPDLPRARFVPCGNAALTGAAYMLSSAAARAEAELLAARTVHVSLADDPSFESLYLGGLPFPAVGPAGAPGEGRDA